MNALTRIVGRVALLSRKSGDAAAASLFDSDYYLANNADVVEGEIDPLAHYMNVGWAEGRNPCALFDNDWYLDQYKDVASAGVNPLTHYVTTGWREGRAPHPFFDAKWYLEAYSDVAAAGLEPLSHYLTAGWREGRKPNPLFDGTWYAEANALPEGANPLLHYIAAGRAAGANPNPYFDGRWYLAAYPDVAQTGMDAFEHFLAAGAAERRRAGPDFHTDWYAEQYPDAVAGGMNPLRHFLEIGEAKGYQPTAFHDADGAGEEPPQEAGETDGPSPEDKPKPRPLSRDPGSILEPPFDVNGRGLYPRRRRGDGRRLACYRLDKDHFWYESPTVAQFFDSLTDARPLPGVQRILVIGHDFVQKTGVMRSLSHYLNALVAAGGYEITSLELAPGADALSVLHDAEVHDVVIVNSLTLFFGQQNGAELMRRLGPNKVAIYLHETDFVFDKVRNERPEEYAVFAEAARDFNFLCVSRQQQRMLETRFGAHRLFLVRETSPIDLDAPAEADVDINPDKPLTIVMAGTLQPRKGVSLFSEVADLAAEAGLPWTFKWAGGEVGLSEGVYRSENVDFVGNLDGAGVLKFLNDADVFFLSSEDDPFPLACLEALQMKKRVIAYRLTGTSEILDGFSGCAVYEEHAPEAAFEALRRAVGAPYDVERCDALNAEFALPGFVKAMSEAIGAFYEPPQEAAPPPASARQKVAAIVHLYYHDLWREIRTHLEALRHLDVDLYVTLMTDKPREELDAVTASILKSWPTATVIECENRGLDVGPFFVVARRIAEEGREYDLLVKLHTKKCVFTSGTAHGTQWRRKLYHRLMGSPSTVDRIMRMMADHPEVGMVGASGMLHAGTAIDRAAGEEINAENIARMAKRMGVARPTGQFFVGTMFWARADCLLGRLAESDIALEDFEEGYVADISTAHAFERLFAYMVRDAGKRLYAFDPELPCAIDLLKDRHKGEDVYVVAAGASADHIDPKFFEGKTTIGVNRVFSRFDCTYAVFKEFGGVEYERELLETGAKPITSKWDAGGIRQGNMRQNTMVFKRPEYYFYDHLENGRDVVDLSVVAPGSEKIVVSHSTITSAMHLAAYMGAKNIILVGHDCGLIDGKATFDGYYKDMSVSPWKSVDEYAAWLDKIEAQSTAVKSKIGETFGAPVHSLNPFINYNLEGRRYYRGAKVMGAVAGAEPDRPVLLLCNGPSAKDMIIPEDLDDYLVVRMNFFFQEEARFANGRVDHLFWSLNEPTFHEELFKRIETGAYNIDWFNCPLPYEALTYSKAPVSSKPFLAREKLRDYWSLIATEPRLAKRQMSRPLPTTGLQALAAMAASGHRSFAVAGMDFYANKDKRYAYAVSDEIKRKLDPKHLKPGYEKGAHSRNADLNFMNEILDVFPDIEIELLSDMPVLSSLLDVRREDRR